MKQVEYRKNIPPAQNVNGKCESDLQFRPHLISTKARIPFFVFFFLYLVFWTAILDFCGGFRWQLVPRLPFPVLRSPLPAPRSPFPVLVTSLIMLLLLHSALGECIRPNLGRSMLLNGDIFASGRSCTFLASCFNTLCS